MDTRKVVSDILAKRIDISNLKEEDSLKNIGLDSLDLVEVMLEIEDTLGIEFDSEEIAELTTLKSVLDLINSKIK
ncbi:MAG: acyl carrier protein [Bacilli bacterium]|nr:acyl carrier protein [Bacilli bacterium]